MTNREIRQRFAELLVALQEYQEETDPLDMTRPVPSQVRNLVRQPTEDAYNTFCRLTRTS
jgi:hypothetical protein